MSVTTTYSEKIDAVKQHLEDSINLLSEIVGDRHMYGANHLNHADRMELLNKIGVLETMREEL
jgi:hypothetical protein